MQGTIVLFSFLKMDEIYKKNSFELKPAVVIKNVVVFPRDVECW